jgi:hypothetical protein
MNTQGRLAENDYSAFKYITQIEISMKLKNMWDDSFPRAAKSTASRTLTPTSAVSLPNTAGDVIIFDLDPSPKSKKSARETTGHPSLIARNLELFTRCIH